MRSQLVRNAMAVGMMLVLCLSTASAQPKKEHQFRGKVEKVDLKAGMLTVNGEDVAGWMSAMTMTYGVDKADVLREIKAGDQITAKVYDGDFKTLHDVRKVPAASSKAPAK
jgi:Cu/Ag efflux protein CusF